MTNEMMRPFNTPAELGGKLRDSLTFNTVEIRLSHTIKDKYLLEITWASNGYQIGYDVTRDSYQEAVRLQSVFLDALYVARNAPVLATEEVLAGLPKDAKVYTVDEKTGDALRCTFDNEFGWGCRTGYFDEALKLGRPYKIFAINDPKTADYLRQFTLEGKLIKQKEMN
jgi:hypothetical protein